MSACTFCPTSVHRLDAYRVAIEMVASFSRLLPGIKRQSAKLADQIERAIPAVPLNLAEAMRRTGRDRAHLLTVSMGSTAEGQAALDVALAMGLISHDDHREAWDLTDRECAMLYRLRQRAA